MPPSSVLCRPRARCSRAFVLSLRHEGTPLAGRLGYGYGLGVGVWVYFCWGKAMCVCVAIRERGPGVTIHGKKHGLFKSVGESRKVPQCGWLAGWLYCCM